MACPAANPAIIGKITPAPVCRFCSHGYDVNDSSVTKNFYLSLTVVLCNSTMSVPCSLHPFGFLSGFPICLLYDTPLLGSGCLPVILAQALLNTRLLEKSLNAFLLLGIANLVIPSMLFMTSPIDPPRCFFLLFFVRHLHDVFRFTLLTMMHRMMYHTDVTFNLCSCGVMGQ